MVSNTAAGCCDSHDTLKAAHGHADDQHHHHEHHHHEKEEEKMAEPDDGVATCLALVEEKGTEISLFDVNGHVRSFAYKGDIHELCFSSHGQESDNLLTPCFDDEGHHGIPDEGCFCGVDTPHLHAHFHNPATCDHEEDEDESDHKKAPPPKEGDMQTELMSLAKITLHPTDKGDYETEEPAKLCEISASVHLQKECNSQAFNQHRIETETTDPHLLKTSRLYKVQHDDHMDYLVHNKVTGDLHLEHPCDDCGDRDYHGRFNLVQKRKWKNGTSGGSDVALHFFKVATKGFSFLDLFEPGGSSRVRAAACDNGGGCTKSKSKATKSCCAPKEEKSCCDSGSCSTSEPVGPSKVSSDGCEAKKSSCCAGGGCDAPTKKVESISQKKSCCVPKEEKGKSCCSGGANNKVEVKKSCSSSGDREKGVPGPSCCEEGGAGCTGALHLQGDWKFEENVGHAVVVRSTFMCTKICCSSEVPMIHSVLKNVPGIEKIMVNVPLKQVLVDHDASILSAADINALLCKNLLGSSIQRDGQPSAAKKGKSSRSNFFVEKICCASEIPAIRSIVGPLDGVNSVKINVTTKMVYVDHDLGRISATDICDALNQDMFGAHIEHDAATDAQAACSFVTSILSLNASDTAEEASLIEFLATYDAATLETSVVDVQAKRIVVVHNPLLLPADDIATALSDTFGLQVVVKQDGKDTVIYNFTEVEEKEGGEAVHNSSTSGLRPAVAMSGILWLVSMLSLIGGDWDYLKYVALASVAFGLPPIALKAARTLRHCRFDANCLMAFAAIGALALEEFTEAAAVTFLFALSEWLEVRATTRARLALSAIVELRPEKANLIHPQTGEMVVVPVGVVPVGALVSVRAGDKVPCDGVVFEGNSTVDESSLTGESRPVRKGPKDKVSGGTINSGNTQMTVRTTASADDSAVARLIRLVEEAQANRSDTEKLVDEFARVYTPVVVFAALAMCSIPWAWGREVGAEWTELGLVVIVVACPCALIISTPVSYVAGLAATAQRGVLIKGGAHLEALGLVKKVCFDKTGTLTQGKFQLLHLDIVGNQRTRKQVLEYLTMMEERASHPLAQALVEGAQNEGVKVPKGLFVKDHTFVAGEGVSGMVNADTVHVGNVRLFKRLGLYDALPDSVREKADEWATIGTVGFMSIGNYGIVCAYCVADAIRPESREVLAKLKSMGIDSVMLTGDNTETAMSIGQSMGLEEDKIKSQLLPEEKLSIVTEMKDGRGVGQSVLANLLSTRELVLMCGDGVNDAPALAIADVGVAMGAGAALAMETADVTLLDSHLDKLVYSIRMGQKVIRKIKENVVFSLAVKFLVLGFALAGKAALWAAIASDVGAMILVTLNSMMLLPAKNAKNQFKHTGAAENNDTDTTKTSAVTESERPKVVEKACCKNKKCCSGE